jgi:hypothetical protein
MVRRIPERSPELPRHDHDRTLRTAKDRSRGGAGQQAPDQAAAVHAHHDQVGIRLIGHPQNGLVRVTRRDDRVNPSGT